MKTENNNLSMELGENKDYLVDFIREEDEEKIDLAKIQKIVQSFARDLQAFREQTNGSQKDAQKIEYYADLLTSASAKIDFLQKQKEGEGGNESVIIRRSNLS